MSLVTDLLERERAAVMQTYGRQPLAFSAGEGSWLTDADGGTYLDCLAGLAVVAVGHANPRVTAAVARQMARLVHVSNLYVTEPMVALAERLARLSGLDRVFFANCGATANEAAIKLARRFGQNARGSQCHRIVSLHDSFHGRTLATLAATGQPQKQARFAPLPAGFVQVPAGDLMALEQAVDDSTAAVMLETIQGEGGVVPLDPSYLRAVRDLCDRTGSLLIIDDVQAGMGRTGDWLSWQSLGFEPDIATMAKALANGLPIGACLATEEVASAFVPGDHATTFGGGPVVCAAALATLDEIEQRGLLANCRMRGDQLRIGLEAIPGVTGVRGRGLLLAAVLADPVAAAVVDAARDCGLIVNAVRSDAVRFAPPLSITEDEVNEAVTRFGHAVKTAAQGQDDA
ncbi:MAG TPA: acetylornithine transaminase [Acidimicrobiia bacterium]|nr:acetylornithine transaminase [Acidimicrobiia bacterium]